MTKPSSKANVAVIQMSCGIDPSENLDKCVALIEEAAKQGAHIVSTSELFRSRYFCQSEDHSNFALAEPIPGPSTEALSKVAAAHNLVIVGSLFERRAPGIYHNTAVVIGADGKLLGRYRKMHIPDDPYFFEAFYFTRGDLGFKSFDTRYGKVGVLICWDQWYPEGARLTALTGAQILFYPTAIGWHPHEKEEYGERQYSSWETIQRSHAIANGIYVAVANRIGHEPPPANSHGKGIEFWGQSFIANPWGQIVAKANVATEQILIAECDFTKIDIQRTHWPFMRDRRIDAYEDLTKRFID